MQCRGAKSFVDDLGLSRGVVLSRAAASLRSIETKPLDWKICPLWTDRSFARTGRRRQARCPTVVGWQARCSSSSVAPCPQLGRGRRSGPSVGRLVVWQDCHSLATPCSQGRFVRYGRHIFPPRENRSVAGSSGRTVVGCKIIRRRPCSQSRSMPIDWKICPLWTDRSFARTGRRRQARCPTVVGWQARCSSSVARPQLGRGRRSGPSVGRLVVWQDCHSLATPCSQGRFVRYGRHIFPPRENRSVAGSSGRTVAGCKIIRRRPCSQSRSMPIDWKICPLWTAYLSREPVGRQARCPTDAWKTADRPVATVSTHWVATAVGSVAGVDNPSLLSRPTGSRRWSGGPSVGRLGRRQTDPSLLSRPTVSRRRSGPSLALIARRYCPGPLGRDGGAVRRSSS